MERLRCITLPRVIIGLLALNLMAYVLYAAGLLLWQAAAGSAAGPDPQLAQAQAEHQNRPPAAGRPPLPELPTPTFLPELDHPYALPSPEPTAGRPPASTPQPTNTPAPLPVRPAPANRPARTATPLAAANPTPTAARPATTPFQPPTYTPQPTYTPRPTYTPAPRPTPAPPGPTLGERIASTGFYRIANPDGPGVYIMTAAQFQFFLNTGIIPETARLEQSARPTPTPGPAGAPNTPVPGATPAGTPGPTRTPAPTNAPEPPTPIPTPPPLREEWDWASLPHSGLLEHTILGDPQAAQKIRDLPWITDRMNRYEAEAAADLIHLALFQEELHDRLHRYAWLQQNFAAARHGPILHWLSALTEIARRDPESQTSAALVSVLLTSSFLRQPDPWDGDALESLYHLMVHPKALAAGPRQFLQLENIADGIDDQEARQIIAAASRLHYADYAAALELSAPNALALQSREYQSPHGHQVLTTLLHRPGQPPDPATLERTIRYLQFLEAYLDAPLPRRPQISFLRSDLEIIERRHVALVYLPQPSADHPRILGYHAGFSIVIAEAAGGPDPLSKHILIHELIHYWFGGRNALWVNEGLADYLPAKVVRSVDQDEPYVRTPPPCAEFDSLSELDAASRRQPGEPGYNCSYGMGYNLFAALEQAFPQEFQERLQALYRDSFQGAGYLNIAALRRHFAGPALEKAYANN